MKFYNEKEQLYLETGALVVSLGACLLQVGDRMWFPKDYTPDNSTLQPIAFTGNILNSAKTWYSNIKREALGIMYGLEKFHHSCSICDVSMITDHNPL